MRQLRKKILYLTVFNGLFYGQLLFVYIGKNQQLLYSGDYFIYKILFVGIGFKNHITFSNFLDLNQCFGYYNVVLVKKYSVHPIYKLTNALDT